MELFYRYGNFTMAYATLQPGMKYFETQEGYLAYDRCWGIPFVLGDPVAPAESHAAVIEAFVRGTHVPASARFRNRSDPFSLAWAGS